MGVEHARRFTERWRAFMLAGDDGIERGGSFWTQNRRAATGPRQEVFCKFPE
jgi:hypothetical protein